MALSFILTIAMLGIPFYGHGTSSVVIGVIVIAALWLYLRPKTQAASRRPNCLLYTSDAADDLIGGDLGGLRIL